MKKLCLSLISQTDSLRFESKHIITVNSKSVESIEKATISVWKPHNFWIVQKSFSVKTDRFLLPNKIVGKRKVSGFKVRNPENNPSQTVLVAKFFLKRYFQFSMKIFFLTYADLAKKFISVKEFKILWKPFPKKLLMHSPFTCRPKVMSQMAIFSSLTGSCNQDNSWLFASELRWFWSCGWTRIPR